MVRCSEVSEGTALFRQDAMKKYGAEVLYRCRPIKKIPVKNGHIVDVYAISDLVNATTEETGEMTIERILVSTVQKVMAQANPGETFSDVLTRII
jgi:hypothetical protein